LPHGWGKGMPEQLTLREIMTNPVVTVEMDDSLDVAREIFEKTRFHHLVVVCEKAEVVGIISDRDVLRELSPYLNTASEQKKDLATLRKKVHQFMTRNVTSASPSTTVKGAALIFLNHSISCLPVVGEDKSLLGIVTWKDVLRCFLRDVSA